MLNNKGQSLVLFVIVLPILVFMLILVIDIGKVIVLKHELGNISEIVLDYGLDNIDSDNIEIELEDLIKLNKSDIDSINIYLQDNKIYIEMIESNEGLFSSLVNISIFNVKTSYVGYLENDKKRIERMGD